MFNTFPITFRPTALATCFFALMSANVGMSATYNSDETSDSFSNGDLSNLFKETDETDGNDNGIFLLDNGTLQKDFSLGADPTDRPSIEIVSAIQRLAKDGGVENAEKLRNLLDDSPKNVRGWAFLAIWAADSGIEKLSKDANQKAQSIDPKNPMVRLSQGVIEGASGDIKQAINTLSALVKDIPRNKNAASRLSNLHLSSGNLHQAVATLEQLISVTGTTFETADLSLNLAGMYLDISAQDKATKILQRYLSIANQPAEKVEFATILAARAAFEAGNLEQVDEYLGLQSDWPTQVNMAALITAAAEWEKSADEQAERQITEMAADPKIGILAQKYLAQIAFKKGEPIEGSRLYDAIIDKTDGIVRLQLLEALVTALNDAGLTNDADNALRSRLGQLGVVGHVMLSDRFLSQGRHKEAIAAAQEGLSKFPKESELAFLRGMSQFMMGQPELAKEGFELATDLNPDHSRAWIAHAKLLHDIGGHGGPGRHDDVIKVYKRALEVSPSNAIIQIELGKVAQEEKRFPAAEDWYRQALVSAPGDPLTEAQLALLLVEVDRLDEAHEFANKAMNSLAGHHQVLFAKGIVDYNSGRYNEAAKTLLAANAIRPQHGHSLAYAAAALEQSSQLEKASQIAIKALYLALRDEEVTLAREVLLKTKGSNKAEVSLNAIDTEGVQNSVGKMTLQDSPMGMRIVISMTGAQPGHNSIHLHENPSCAPAFRDDALVAGLSAGAHLGVAQAGGGGHAHAHAAPSAPAATDGSPKMEMKVIEPMVMEMVHGEHKMNMVMRSNDLPIGDLPLLIGNDDGLALMDVVVPYMHTSMLQQRSVIVHDGMQSLRAYCGVIRY